MLPERSTEEKEFLNEFQDLTNHLTNPGIEEKLSVCPECQEEINIYIENHYVTCYCKHCGFSRAQKY